METSWKSKTKTGPFYYITTGSDIDSTEITRTLDRGQGVLKKMAIKAGIQSLYSMRECGQCERILLYLRLYGIETWDNTDGAVNFFSIEEMKQLLSSIEQSFGVCS